MTAGNIELLDLVEEIITEVPALHFQRAFSFPVNSLDGDRADAAREQRSRHPELPIPEPCGTAFCVAGWAMIAAGYTFADNRFHRPGDQETIDDRRYRESPTTDWHANRHAPEVLEAAALLGIDPDEAYSFDDSLDKSLRGIFYDANNLAQIRIWMRYYRGEIEAGERDDLLRAAAG